MNLHGTYYTNAKQHSFRRRHETLTTSITSEAIRTNSGNCGAKKRSKFSCGLIFGFPQQGLGVFRGSFATSHRRADRFGWTLTLQSSRHDILIHVVHVVGHDEVLRCCSSAAHEGGVEVEGWGQRRKAWVVDDGKTCEDLYLLPAMQPLSQSSGHLAQGLSMTGKEAERRLINYSCVPRLNRTQFSKWILLGQDF